MSTDLHTVPTRPRRHTASRVLILAALAAAMTFSAGVLRADAGSDSPTPYTVDRTGITLPAGQTFPDNGHVNIRWNGGSAGLHFESKCITRTDAECAGARHEAAQYIGASFIPWSAFGVPADACIEWVQIAQYQEHYGEGGQSPVCLTEEDPCPTETTPAAPPESPQPTPSETQQPEPQPSEPSQSPSTPTPTDEPSEQPSPSTEPPTSPSPLPSDPEPSDSPTSPVTSPTPVNTDPTPTSTGPDESTTPAEDYNQGDDEPYRAEVSAVDDDVPAVVKGAVLAATGTNALLWIGVASILVIAGLIAIGVRRGGRK